MQGTVNARWSRTAGAATRLANRNYSIALWPCAMAAIQRRRTAHMPRLASRASRSAVWYSGFLRKSNRR